MKRTIPLAVFAICAAHASIAAADPTAQERVLAESLFRDGKTLVDKGKIAEACPKFAESERLDPAAGTLLYLATCHEQEGKTASAWSEFSAAVGMAQRAHESARENIARTRAEALEKKLTKLTIAVQKPSADLEVRFDGAVIGRATWGAPFPVDPGKHKVEASSAKHKAWSTDVVAPPGPASASVEVPELEADAVAVVPPVIEPPNNGRLLGGEEVVVEPHDGRRKVGFVVGGVGVAGVAVGAIFGLVAISNKSSADKLGQAGACAGSQCTQAALDKYSSAHVAANVSTVGFVAGLVGVGIGAALVLASPKEESPRAWLAPTMLPGGGGATGGFVF